MKKKLIVVLMILCCTTLSVLASDLISFKTWDDSEGPQGREHSLSWIHKDKYYLVGGYGFAPFQGVNTHSLWQLDLKTKKWSMLPTVGNPASSSARAYPSPHGNGIITMSNEPISFGRQKLTTLHHLDIVGGIGRWRRIDIPLVTEVNVEFIKRSSHLSSLIYNEEDKSFYSICSITDCNVYKVNIQDSVASIKKVNIRGKQPQGRIAYAYGYSQSSNLFILASGQIIKDNQTSFSSDIWTLNLKRLEWTQYKDVMEKRRNPCFGLHEKKQKLLIWGGTNDGENSIAGVNNFDLNELKYEENIPNEHVRGSERSSCFSAYHDNYGVLTGFGNSIQNNESVIFQDLWQYH
jgi:hypothetical protein